MFARRRKKKWPVVLAILLVCLALLAVLGYYAGRTLTLEIHMHGSQNVKQEYTSAYTDPGAEAVLTSSIWKQLRWTLPVQTSDLVAADTVGAYGVVYRAEFLWLSATQARVVQIVDTQAPTITFTEDAADFILPGQEYAGDGFQAYDDYDGDISHLVTWELQGEKLVYSVKDSSGNVATAFRVIQFDDPIPPQLELKGEAEQEIYLGRPYEEPGFSATDNFDGDMTGKVVVDGVVDTLTKGEYSVTYTVTDTFGNTASAVRKVTVSAAPQPETVIPEGKVIYLTFDDGPSKHTKKLLEILRKYDVKATFFVVDTPYVNLLPEIVADGHAIGVHTGSHVYQDIYASEKAFFEDFKTIHSRIQELTGVTTTLMRFPGGSSNRVSAFNPGIMTRLTRLVTDYGLQYFDWNVDSMDATQAQSAQEVVQRVISGVGNRSCAVVLQHDLFEFSVEAVEQIIQWGQENGYRFLPLDPSSPKEHQTVMN